MQLILDLMTFLFSKKKRLIYTTFKQAEYYKASSSLEASGISFRTKMTNHHRTALGQPQYFNENRNSDQYDIFVTEEDEHSALKAIHQKNR